MIWKLAVKRQLRRSRDNGGGRAVMTAALQFDRRICFLTALLLTANSDVSGQSADSLAIRFSGMTAITGYEQGMTDSLLALLPGSTRDRIGNVTLTLGRGAPRRLVYCALDEIGYVVGNITDDGYILLRRVGGGLRLSPLFDQQLEGQRVTLFGRKGAVPGVVAVRSTHLTRGRPSRDEPPFTVDNAYVDIGANSRDEVLGLGISILSPVSLTKRPHRYGDRLLSASTAGRRAACAALAAAALSRPRARGTVVVAFTVQSLYADTAGLKTVVNTQGPSAKAGSSASRRDSRRRRSRRSGCGTWMP